MKTEIYQFESFVFETESFGKKLFVKVQPVLVAIREIIYEVWQESKLLFKLKIDGSADTSELVLTDEFRSAEIDPILSANVADKIMSIEE